MLSAFVSIPSRYVTTPWFLKLDTDTYAINDYSWIDESWFDQDVCFISNPWGYTKPANSIDILDTWGDTIDDLKNKDRLNIHLLNNELKLYHPRIISWLYFCRTEWMEKVSSYTRINNSDFCKLPVPSQDTYCFYCAERRKDKYIKIKFKRRGWVHIRKTVSCPCS
jgi:hypothetical protein